MEFKGIMKDNKLARMGRTNLEKECCRKGIPTFGLSSTDLALRVAYAEGYNIGKSEQKPACFMAAKSKTEKKKYRLEDMARDDTFYLSLSDEQANVIKWLTDNELLFDVEIEEIGEIEFEEI